MAPEGPPGSKTVARLHGRVGNSGGPIDSLLRQGKEAQPANREES